MKSAFSNLSLSHMSADILQSSALVWVTIANVAWFFIKVNIMCLSLFWLVCSETDWLNFRFTVLVLVRFLLFDEVGVANSC